MANPNIWAPGQALNANSSIRFESFTATTDQILFELNDFQYALGTGSIMVFVSGIAQRPGIDFYETSVSSFTLSTPVAAGTIVLAMGMVEVSAILNQTTVITDLYIAVGGETLLQVSNFSYEIGGHHLHVFRNGLHQEVGYDYTETSETSITLSVAAEADDRFIFVSNLFVVDSDLLAYKGELASYDGADKIGYKSSFLGSITTTVKEFLDRFIFLNNGNTTHSDGLNSISGSSRLFLGNNTPSTDDSALLIGRGLSGSYFSGAHAIRDETTYSASGTGLFAYASYDSIPRLGGTVNYNHLHSFQARPEFNGNETLGQIAGLTVQFNNIGVGIIDNAYGYRYSNAQGPGQINFQAALWCDPLSGAAANYCLYSPDLNTPSYHGGVWQTGSAILAAGQLNGQATNAVGTPESFSASGGLLTYYLGSGVGALRSYTNNVGGGGGHLQFMTSSSVNAYLTTNAFFPGNDNLFDLGAPSKRFSTVYAGTGTINTSDIREKEQIRILTEQEKAVAIRLKTLIRAFKFKDAVKEKGDSARIHFGVMAQEVREVFISEGLSADNYALFCYDEWEEQPEIRNENQEIIQQYRAAGNRYGVRYEELLAFIISVI